MIILIFLTLFTSLANAQINYNYRHADRLAPDDYLLNFNGRNNDPVFDEHQTIDLGLDLGVGSDCGRIDLKGTLRATLQNVLDSKYFEQLGQDIIASSPMLITCYFSPSWCSILKHSRISSQYLSQLRVNQCSLIEKYQDSRVEDFYAERQDCYYKALRRHGGNADAAMEECKNHNMYQYNLADWTGSSNGRKTGTNKLIESSAKWAGFKGKDSEKVVNLAKSMVGDMVISKGKLSIDYGPRKLAATPRTHLEYLTKETEKLLCDELLPKIDKNKHRATIEQIVKTEDLVKISGSEDKILIDRQSIRSLSYFPFRQRSSACKRIAETIAINRFSYEMDQTLDVLQVSSQNVNLPEKKQRRLRYEKDALAASVKRTLDLNKERTRPLNSMLQSINKEGLKYIDKSTARTLRNDVNSLNSKRVDALFWDCADGIMCDSGGTL